MREEKGARTPVARRAPRGAWERAGGPRALPMSFRVCEWPSSSGLERKGNLSRAGLCPTHPVSSPASPFHWPCQTGMPRRKRGAQAEGAGCYVLPGFQAPF